MCVKVISLKEKLYGPMSLEIARTQNMRCQMLLAKGDIETAEPLCESVLKILEAIRGSQHSEVAMALGIC